MKSYKIGFYAPMKPLNAEKISGDLIIARSLVSFFREQGHKLYPYSDFQSRWCFSSFQKMGGVLKQYPYLFQRLKRFKPDLLFTYHNYYKAPDPFGPLLAKALNIPYFVFEGMVSEKRSKELKTFLGHHMSYWGIKSAKAVFPNSQKDHDILLNFLPEGQVHLVLPGVSFATETYPIEELIPRDKSVPLIACVAMLRPDRKTEGFKFLLQALEKIKTPFQMIHIGEGECLEEVKSLGTKNVFYLGKKDPQEIASILNACDLYCFPGIKEALGMAYMEAHAAGLPVVAFNNGGIPSVVDHEKTGFLTPVNDMDAYVRSIELLLTDKDMRLKMGKKAKLKAQEEFNQKKNYLEMWDKIESFL